MIFNDFQLIFDGFRWISMVFRSREACRKLADGGFEEMHEQA